MPSLVIFTIKSIELSTFNILLKGILCFVISEILFISKKYCLGVFNCSWPDRASFRFSVKVTICFNVLTISLFVAIYEPMVISNCMDQGLFRPKVDSLKLPLRKLKNR